MKTIAVLLVFFLSLDALHSKELPFKIERMNTDFRGVTSNGKNILCYGDYGIITYTLDFGQNFQQLNLGDRYSIKRLFSIGNDFIGATDYSLLKSTTNGLTWENKDVFENPEIIDAAIHNKVLYLLTKTGVYTADSNLTIKPSPILALDSTAEYSEIKTNGEDIYIIYNKRNILHYSISSRQSDTVDAIKKAAFFCMSCTNVINMQLFGNTIYLMINLPDLVNNLFLVKTDNKGTDWKTLSGFIFNNGCYVQDSNSVYGLIPLGTTKGISNEYIHIDTSIIRKNDTTDYTVLNDKYSVDRTISTPKDDPYAYSELLHITKDTLIAVGTNKLIIMSYDGGKTWKLKSFFRTFYLPGNALGSFPTKNLGYIQNRSSFYTTRNGAITWLPQKYKKNIPATGRDKSNSFFNSTGLGYLRYITENINDTNLLVTKDYGDTYNLYFNDLVSHYNYDNIENPMKPTQGIDLGNTILYTMRRGDDTSSYTIVLRYDTNFRLIDTVRLNCKAVHTILKTRDSIVFILGLNYSDDNTTDSLGTAGNYKYSYFILKSTDKGKTWDSTYVPIPEEVTKLFDGTYHYTSNIYSNPGTLTGNYILFPYSTFSLSKRLEGYSLIYRYDYKNNIFDSIKILTTITENPLVIFSFGSKVFLTSYQNNYLLSTNDISAKNPLWDSVNIADIFSNWEGYDPTYLQDNKDAVLSYRKFDDTSGFLFIGKSMKGIGGKQFKINPVKISLRSITSVKNEQQVNQERAYLASLYPYPIPGANMIRCQIYWNPSYDVKDIAITIYDIYGKGGDYQKVKINKTDNYIGILEWNCSDVPSGVYIIQISLGGESHSFPVMVVK